MPVHTEPVTDARYAVVSDEKSGGATYTPKILADFVAQQILRQTEEMPEGRPLRILDPAIGHGELLVSLLEQLPIHSKQNIEIHGFETDQHALDIAAERLHQLFPSVSQHLEFGNFLNFVVDYFGSNGNANLFQSTVPESFDLIIANPPYVRTQIMGATAAQQLAKQFGLTGRVDLYYAFILGMSQVLKPKGVAGIIVSNRFMSTKSGASVRLELSERFNICHAWDLGDTKLFNAAVLPAVLLVEGKNGSNQGPPGFTSIYQSDEHPTESATNPISALNSSGVVEIQDGRSFNVQHGRLDTSGTSSGIWRIATEATDKWLETVEAHSWGTFRDIGKIRVGVKTCADKIFIRNDWQDTLAGQRPELLKALTTHHVANRFKPLVTNKPRQIIYPHEVVNGRRRAVNLTKFPRSQAYFKEHRSELEGRKYVIEAGREWFEIWVPQDPEAWLQTKLVFRDISESPTFWLDLDGSVVNGDCYWLVCNKAEETDLLWLAAAIGNSTFIEHFYDLRFHNKLYSGRRRFITQYVEKFPLLDPQSRFGKAIVSKAKRIYDLMPLDDAQQLQKELDALVWRAFGLAVKEPSR
ncbi:MAG: N-6 DNA methylase [Granulosicoccaceae bacterium]